MSYEKESNLLAIEQRKVVVNLHPAEKIRNHFCIDYVIEKHFENRFCYGLINTSIILSVKKLNKI